jgi:hypothetical protein
VRLESLRFSGPPALALLGSSPADVQRPNTPRELIVSLVSGAGTDGIVPDGYALEVAPFWLVRRRALTVREYHRPAFTDRIKYFTAISFGASRPRPDSSNARPDARVAIAIRTLLFNGRPSAALVELQDSIRARQIDYIEVYRRWEVAQGSTAGLEAAESRLARQEELLGSLVTRVTAGAQSSLRDSAMRTLARRDSLKTVVGNAQAASAQARRLAGSLDGIEERLETLAKRFMAREADPDGFTLELAAGTRSEFEGGEWTRQRADRLGVWLTPMYRLGAKDIELIGVVRYLSNVRRYRGSDLLDFGGRVAIDVGRGSFSGEHVWRRAHDPDDDGTRRSTRWALLFDYPVGGRLRASASFGSDYRRPAGDRPVIATVGIDLGFGAIEIRP